MKSPKKNSLESIDVFKNEIYVGQLSRTAQGSRFEYSKEILAHPTLSKISYQMRAQSDPLEVTGVNLTPYFAGLLPEGLRLKALVKNLKTSEDDLFSILVESGSEPVGDLHFKMQGSTRDSKPKKFSTDDFSKFKNEILKSLETLNNPVSGVQNKISGSRLTLPLKGGFKAKNKQFILKFDASEMQNLIENEWHCLKLAKACGIKVTDAKIIKDSKGESALLVTRFDREWLPEKKMFTRFHLEDACQFLNRYPADKYNLTMQEIAIGITQFCESPQIQILSLLRLAAFSYLIGNGDLHGKNISLMQRTVSELSPAYDLVCTYVYGDHQMALALDGKKDNWKRKLLIKFGERYGVPAISTEKMLDHLVLKFAKNNKILFNVPFLASKKVLLDGLFKKRLVHLASD